MMPMEHQTGRSLIAAAPAGKAAYETGRLGHGLLTYAILEAFHRRKDAPTEPIDVFGLATHVIRQVPVLSQREFGIHQQPIFTPAPTGGNFPIGVRTAVLKDGPILIPTAPTHMNLAVLKIFKEPGGKGGVVLTLQPLTSITLIKSERGWAHIARDGKALGYVSETKLKRLN